MSTVADWAAPNPVTENRSGLIGKAVDRYEGPLKVSGSAPYAFEVVPPSAPAYGHMVEAAIPVGRIAAIDTTKAASLPGVVTMFTHKTMPGPQVFTLDWEKKQLCNYITCEIEAIFVLKRAQSS